MVILAAKLANNDIVTRIDLRLNNISDEGAEALTTALRTKSTITVIDLYNSNISNEGVEALEEMFNLYDTRAEIDLRYNEIEDIISSTNGALAANKVAPLLSRRFGVISLHRCYFTSLPIPTPSHHTESIK